MQHIPWADRFKSSTEDWPKSTALSLEKRRTDLTNLREMFIKNIWPDILIDHCKTTLNYINETGKLPGQYIKLFRILSISWWYINHTLKCFPKCWYYSWKFNSWNLVFQQCRNVIFVHTKQFTAQFLNAYKLITLAQSDDYLKYGRHLAWPQDKCRW